MNKGELITAIAEKSGLLKKDAAKALDAFMASVEESIKKDEKVILTGFGTFELKSRAPRKGRDLTTFKEIVIPASRVPAFKPGKAFKTKVNK
jgi:DNA-binding protein HU-beta